MMFLNRTWKFGKITDVSKENGTSAAFRDPYFLRVDWDILEVRIQPRRSTLQQTVYFEKIKLPRPVDPQTLSEELRKDGVPEAHTADLVKSVRQSLSEI